MTIATENDLSADTVLARYDYPLPDGKPYYVRDLEDPNGVEEVFDYCQILLAVIYPIGWRFLFKNYGFEGLHEINECSRWLDGDNKQEIFEWFIYHMQISGYDPLTDK